MSRVRVAVVGGGRSCEHDVSLASAASVRAGLDPVRYDVVDLTIDRDGTWHRARVGPLSPSAAVATLASCDVVFPAVHGAGGEDGTLAALCDLVGVPCVGSGVNAGALGMDKWATKLVASSVGVAVAPGVLVTPHDVPPVWNGPVVVKPVSAGSSFGVTKVVEPECLKLAVNTARTFDSRVLVEDLVVGSEVDIAVLRTGAGVRVSPPLEVVHGAGEVFGTAQKYDGSAVFCVPANVEAGTRVALEQQAVAVFDALGCAGVARVDFFVTSDGLVLNEVNTMPGLTEESQVPRMFAADGLPYPALLDQLVRSALAG